jgi:hypothetical protein
MRILFFISLLFLFSCGNKNRATKISLEQTIDTLQTNDIVEFVEHIDTNFVSVLLNSSFEGKVNVYDESNSKIIKTVKNNFEEDEFVRFDLLKKKDSMYSIIAYSALNNKFITKGWINKNNNLTIFSAAYGERKFILYKYPYNKREIIIIGENNTIKEFDVLDYEGRWLKIKAEINGKFYIGWISPDLQCANPYTTCS